MQTYIPNAFDYLTKISFLKIQHYLLGFLIEGQPGNISAPDFTHPFQWPKLQAVHRWYWNFVIWKYETKNINRCGKYFYSGAAWNL